MKFFIAYCAIASVTGLALAVVLDDNEDELIGFGAVLWPVAWLIAAVLLIGKMFRRIVERNRKYWRQ